MEMVLAIGNSEKRIGTGISLHWTFIDTYIFTLSALPLVLLFVLGICVCATLHRLNHRHEQPEG